MKQPSPQRCTPQKSLPLYSCCYRSSSESRFRDRDSIYAIYTCEQGIATIRRAEHALSKSVPQLWVVSRDGLDEELVGDGEALNDELNDGTFVQRLQRAGIPFLSQENYW